MRAHAQNMFIAFMIMSNIWTIYECNQKNGGFANAVNAVLIFILLQSIQSFIYIKNNLLIPYSNCITL